MIEFDLILDKIGHLGRYQLLLCGLVYWLGVPAGLHSIASVFYAVEVPFRCNVPPLDNVSVYPSLTEEDILNYSTPYDDASESYNGCKRYGFDLTTCEPPGLLCVNTDVASISCDAGYHFDTTQFDSTVNSEWNLVCDRKILGTIATSLFFAGMWAGAVVFGFLADLIGRRYTMLIAAAGTLVSGVATAFTPWLELFIVLRFFSAAFSHAAYLIMFIYVVEITGKKRTATGVQVHTAFAVGYSLNSLFAYFLRDWRTFYFAISTTPLLYFAIHFFVPESPRWHFSYGRNKLGKRISLRFAKYNNKVLTEKDWEDAIVNQTDENLSKKNYSFVDLFRTLRMRRLTFNMMYSWMVISMVYYGLSLNAGALAGDIFLNNALNGLLEIVGYVSVQLLMNRIGRKLVLVSTFAVQSIALLISIVCTETADGNKALVTTGVVFAFIGKVGVAGGFAIIFNYTAELYPTVVRGNALGFGSMAARVGSISSPYIILLQDYVSWLPTTVFAVLSIIATFTSFLYPETKGRKMPQTIDEAEMFYAGLDITSNHKTYKESRKHLKLTKL